MMKDSSISHPEFVFVLLFFSFPLCCCIWKYVEHILSLRIKYGFMIKISYGYVIFNVFFLYSLNLKSSG